MDIWKKIFLMSCMLLAIFFTVNINADQECAVAKSKVQKTNFKMIDSQTTGNIQNSAESATFPSNKRGEGCVRSEIQNVSSTLIGDSQSIIASLQSTPKHSQINKTDFSQKTQKLQMPFIANNGQLDETVKFYAKTFAGSVFVTNDGEIVYSLPAATDCKSQNVASEKFPSTKRGQGGVESETCNPQLRGLILKEEFVGEKINEIKGESQSVTKVNYFKGNDPSQWKTNVSTYELVNLGEVYEGIGLSLKAYGNNVEKLFYVKPGANPEQIKIRVDDIQPPESPLEKGGRGLYVSERGELVVKTEFGDVKFSKPVAYQIIDGKRVEVEVEYSIQKSETEDRYQNKDTNHKDQKSETRPVGWVKLSVPNKQPPASPFSKGDFSREGFAALNPRHKGMVRRLCKHQSSKQSTLLAQNYSLNQNHSNPQSEIHNINTGTDNGHVHRSMYGFKLGIYDKTKELVIDPLLSSTYLGGSDNDFALSIDLDASGNVYVTGWTESTDFPTISGAYDTSYGGGTYDVFISRLNSDLTTLSASTYLG